jgi:hypothetical protein
MAKKTFASFPVFFLMLFLLCNPGTYALGQSPYAKQAVISESGGKLRLVANDSRPLIQALTALQQKYGWLVNYEDPPYDSKLDSTSVKGPDGERRLPSGGEFTVELGPVSTPDAPPDEQKTLQLLVDSYNKSSNPGRFEFRKDKNADNQTIKSPTRKDELAKDQPTKDQPSKDQPGKELPGKDSAGKAPLQIFSIVGTSAHDSQGKISPQPVLLDSQITISAQERSFSDTGDLICQNLAEKSHIKVSLGVYPLGLARTNVSLGGKDLAARDYLARAIEASGRKLVWRLLYDPDSSSYILNFHQVRVP